MIQRRQIIRRSRGLERTTRIRSRSPRRASEDAKYSKVSAEYLAEHPLCQLTIAVNGFDEAEVLAALRAAGGFGSDPLAAFCWGGKLIPRSVEIHHRNKRHGRRRCDVRWFMAVSRMMHDLVESRKNWARVEGYLLPINADPDGRWPDGTQFLTTPQLMDAKATFHAPP